MTPDDEEIFEREIQSRLSKMHQRRVADLNQRGLAWLALVPAWTEDVANACGFPAGSTRLANWIAQRVRVSFAPTNSEQLHSFLERAERAGLCTRHSVSNQSHVVAVHQALALVRLAPHLPEDMIGEGLAVVRAIKDEQARMVGLAAMAPYLPEPLIKEALILAWTTKHHQVRHRALLALAPHLPENLIRQAFLRQLVSPSTEATLDYTNLDVQVRAQVLAQLAGRVPEGLLSLVRMPGGFIPQAPVLVALAQQLSSISMDDALAIARSIEAPIERCEALASLAPYVVEASRDKILRELFSAVQANQSVGGRTRGFALMIRVLAQVKYVRTAVNVLRRVLAEAPGDSLGVITEVLDDVVKALVQSDQTHLARIIVQEIRTATRAIDNVYHRAQTLCDIVHALSLIGEEPGARQVATRAFATARRVTNVGERAVLLARLATYLDGDLQSDARAEAIAAARQIHDSGERIATLASLASHLPPLATKEVVKEALTTLLSIGGEARFWMPEAVRNSILESLRRDSGSPFLRQEASTIGYRIMHVRRQGMFVSPAVARWAELASYTTAGLDEAAEWLQTHIQRLLKRNDTGQALIWAATGATLAQALGGELETAVAACDQHIKQAFR